MDQIGPRFEKRGEQKKNRREGQAEMAFSCCFSTPAVQDFRAGLKGVIFCCCVFDLDLLLDFFLLSQGVQFFGVCPMASVVFVRSCNDETANESRAIFVPRFYFLLAHKAAFYCTFIVC